MDNTHYKDEKSSTDSVVNRTMDESIKAPRELAPHEKSLFRTGLLTEQSHRNSTSRWFYGPLGSSSRLSRVQKDESIEQEETMLIYRHMGDVELSFLLAHNQLPETQPYQTLVRGVLGFKYCLKYFEGKKKVATNVVTIIEFTCPAAFVDQLFRTFHKAEDGCVSTGLGKAAGKTLHLFNAGIRAGWIRYQPVFVKRPRRR